MAEILRVVSFRETDDGGKGLLEMEQIHFSHFMVKKITSRLNYASEMQKYKVYLNVIMIHFMIRYVF